MAVTYNKRELEKKKEKKRQDKQKRKEVRKASGGSSSFEDMIAYVDENGVITSTPPDYTSKPVVDMESIAISTPKREEPEDVVLTGRVEHFNAARGYGFIKPASGAEKYFFHVSSAPANIAEGDKVTFEPERGLKGMNATKIAIAGKSQL